MAGAVLAVAPRLPQPRSRGPPRLRSCLRTGSGRGVPTRGLGGASPGVGGGPGLQKSLLRPQPVRPRGLRSARAPPEDRPRRPGSARVRGVAPQPGPECACDLEGVTAAVAQARPSAPRRPWGRRPCGRRVRCGGPCTRAAPGRGRARLVRSVRRWESASGRARGSPFPRSGAAGISRRAGLPVKRHHGSRAPA